jgi:hypothetical protein
MKTKKGFFVVIALLCAIVGPAAAQTGAPEWVKDTPSPSDGYYVWIQALNERGASPLSEAASKTLSLQAPAAPTLIAGKGSLTVNWEAADMADSYNVYYNTAQTLPASPAQTGITSTSITITGLISNTAYYVWIEAMNARGTKLGERASGTTTTGSYTVYDTAAFI